MSYRDSLHAIRLVPLSFYSSATPHPLVEDADSHIRSTVKRTVSRRGERA